MKKPSFDSLKSSCPEIHDNLIKEHISRLGEEYFEYFSGDEICGHLKAISKLSLQESVDVLCASDTSNPKRISCVVVGHDYPSVLSLITGILATLGMRIISGRIFTYSREAEIKTSRELKVSRKIVKSAIKKRIIIDYFNGQLTEAFSYLWLQKLKSALTEVFDLLDAGDEDSAKRARKKVNELAAVRISDINEKADIFYPIAIEFDNSNESYTALKVTCQDTPFFLYTFSSSLSMEGILIEYVNIKTIKKEIMDEFYITDSSGKKIEDAALLEKIKFIILLIKQFTYFIGNSPDPFAALSRFEFLTHEILSLPEKDNWKDMLLDPRLLKDLARLLGTSDFIWEDFVRAQYETILPLLKSGKGKPGILAGGPKSIPQRLTRALKRAGTRQEQRDILNDFKDREIFHIDLYYILNPGKDIRALSEHLTVLAETVVNSAVNLAYDHLVEIHGHPSTVAGLRTKYSILGLGKFGGAALGYASDIELLLVYSDSGNTDGKDQVDNSLFFDSLVREVLSFIRAKKEGIFDLDLRLRPYGSKGPLATSLDLFCTYYGPGGSAHSYERLALVRMRPVGGDGEFGNQLTRLRDEFVYFTKSIDVHELNDIRKKQLAQNIQPGRINAKFSSGALVDIEYSIELLQVMYGKDYPDLRTSRLHQALTALEKAGILAAAEAEQLVKTYDFFRLLINGLRMLRGSAKDLFMPHPDSPEFGHLARRMGYTDDADLSSAQKLHMEFDTRSAMIRAFIERRFGEEMMAGEKTGNIADIVITDELPESLKEKILSAYGFTNPERAFLNLKKLSGHSSTREIFTGLAVLAMDMLTHKSDPDTALNNWERFADRVDKENHYLDMREKPKKLDILLTIFSSSQYLSDTLIKNPGFLEWVVVPANLYKSLNRKEIEKELKKLYARSATHDDWLNKMRVLKKREILRIGTRDICLAMPLRDIVTDLSILAESFIEVSAEQQILTMHREDKTIDTRHLQENFMILAFGKLGGNELNYSSDIDLMLVYASDDDEPALRELYSRIMWGVAADLSRQAEEGHAFRVDLRLRPYGSSGALAYSVHNALEYYRKAASDWEIQALLKLRPVAGNIASGVDFIRQLYAIVIERLAGMNISGSIERMRSKSIKEKSRKIIKGIDIKDGPGGIRDIEFLVQGLELMNLAQYPELMEGNTVRAIGLLKELGIMDGRISEELKNDYEFLRRVEHYLQLYEDRQEHSLPKDPAKLEALSRSMLGLSSSSATFMSQLEECRTRIRAAYARYMP